MNLIELKQLGRHLGEIIQMKNSNKTNEEEIRIRGKIEALRVLANDVRLSCSRNGMLMEAAAIKLMQDALLQLHRMKNNV